MKSDKTFVEIDFYQLSKHSQMVCGDAFMSRKFKTDKRFITVLSDGLGSGVKANVLSTMTATMALNYVSHNYDLKETSRAIMQTLPVCSVRKISYSTFTIVDMDHNGIVHLIEYGNPSALVIRNRKVLSLERHKVNLIRPDQFDDDMIFSSFKMRLGDRIVLMSDGITQSGLGSRIYPLGWGEKAAADFVCEIISRQSSVSARYLSRAVVEKALVNDHRTPFDDMTCGVINVREPRELLLVSGPPIDSGNDGRMAEIFRSFNGKKIICGGTTANIIARETREKISMNLKDFDIEIPTTSRMNGADLVTEGSITLGKVMEILEEGRDPEKMPRHGAAQLVTYLLNSDKIYFLVGTKINEAHQDPNIPVQLEIRRNLIKQIIRLLEERYFKETEISFI